MKNMFPTLNIESVQTVNDLPAKFKELGFEVQDEKLLVKSNGNILMLEKAIVIEKGTSTGYPTVVLLTKTEDGKTVPMLTSFRILNGLMSYCKGIAQKNGLNDF